MTVREKIYEMEKLRARVVELNSKVIRLQRSEARWLAEKRHLTAKAESLDYLVHVARTDPRRFLKIDSERRKAR